MATKRAFFRQEGSDRGAEGNRVKDSVAKGETIILEKAVAYREDTDRRLDSESKTVKKAKKNHI